MIPNKAITKQEFNHLITYQKLVSGGEATICESDTPCLYINYFLKDKNQLKCLRTKLKR